MPRRPHNRHGPPLQHCQVRIPRPPFVPSTTRAQSRFWPKLALPLRLCLSRLTRFPPVQRGAAGIRPAPDPARVGGGTAARRRVCGIGAAGGDGVPAARDQVPARDGARVGGGAAAAGARVGVGAPPRRGRGGRQRRVQGPPGARPPSPFLTEYPHHRSIRGASAFHTQKPGCCQPTRLHSFTLAQRALASRLTRALGAGLLVRQARGGAAHGRPRPPPAAGCPPRLGVPAHRPSVAQAPLRRRGSGCWLGASVATGKARAGRRLAFHAAIVGVLIPVGLEQSGCQQSQPAPGQWRRHGVPLEP